MKRLVLAFICFIVISSCQKQYYISEPIYRFDCNYSYYDADKNITLTSWFNYTTKSKNNYPVLKYEGEYFTICENETELIRVASPYELTIKKIETTVKYCTVDYYGNYVY